MGDGCHRQRTCLAAPSPQHRLNDLLHSSPAVDHDHDDHQPLDPSRSRRRRRFVDPPLICTYKLR